MFLFCSTSWSAGPLYDFTLSETDTLRWCTLLPPNELNEDIDADALRLCIPLCVLLDTYG